MDEKKYLTVSAINKYIAYKLDSDSALRELYIKGEISNARFSKGHLYFVLKDEESEISAIMFASLAQRLTFDPEDGLKVLVTASLSSYPKKGTYNLIVSKMEEFGKGLIYQRFLELKQKLETLGLFAPEHKKLVPKFPKHIGVITSDTGDAIKDILSTIQKRYPLSMVRIYKSLVQGPDAPESLINSIRRANEEEICDVLIIARGGGAIEDLDCFNDPNLAYAIYDSKIPIISGVGHENDFTICDFVADLRAPTPTGAAVLATPSLDEILKTLSEAIGKMDYSIINMLKNKYNEIKHLKELLDAHSPVNEIYKLSLSYNNLYERLIVSSPVKLIDSFESDIAILKKNLDTNYSHLLIKKENSFNSSIDKLILTKPLNIMKKGYTLVYKDDKLIKSQNDLFNNDEINIKFSDGDVRAVVKKG